MDQLAQQDRKEIEEWMELPDQKAQEEMMVQQDTQDLKDQQVP